MIDFESCHRSLGQGLRYILMHNQCPGILQKPGLEPFALQIHNLFPEEYHCLFYRRHKSTSTQPNETLKNKKASKVRFIASDQEYIENIEISQQKHSVIRDSRSHNAISSLHPRI